MESQEEVMAARSVGNATACPTNSLRVRSFHLPFVEINKWRSLLTSTRLFILAARADSGFLPSYLQLLVALSHINYSRVVSPPLFVRGKQNSSADVQPCAHLASIQQGIRRWIAISETPRLCDVLRRIGSHFLVVSG